MLRTRILTAAIALPLLIAAVIVGGPAFTVLLAVAVATAAAEYGLSAKLTRLQLAAAVLLAAAFVIIADIDYGLQLWVAVVAVTVAPDLRLFRRRRPQEARSTWSSVTFAAFYFGWLGSHAVLLRDLDDGREWLFLGLFAVFATDTAAYFVGRTVGRHRMAPEAHQLLIQPYDRTQIAAIEKAIRANADLNMNPSNDGAVIRIAIPPLNEQRRKELVRVAHKKAEEGHIAVRNIRRDLHDTLRKQEKAHDISEDESRRLQEQLQKITDEHIARIDATLKAKEAEIMEV